MVNDMSQPDKVKLELWLPQELWDALTWYVRRTIHWISNDMEDQSVNALIIEMVTGYMRAEAENPLIAIEWLKYVLREEHGLK